MKTDNFKPYWSFNNNWLEGYQEGGKISKSGYKRDSPDKSAPWLKTPSDNISMSEVDHSIIAFPNNGSPTIMRPEQNYFFPNANNVYRLTIYIPSNSTTSYQTLEVLTKTGITTYTSSNSAKIPAAGLIMYVHQYVNTASGSASVGMVYILGYCELY